MNWICYDPETKTFNTRSRTLYLRPKDEKKHKKYKPTNIVLMKVYAMDYFFSLPNNPFKSSDYQQIYYEELAHQSLFVRENTIEKSLEKELRYSFTVCLKTYAFSEQELLKWCRAVLVERGEHITNITPTGVESFQELTNRSSSNTPNHTLLKRITRLFS